MSQDATLQDPRQVLEQVFGYPEFRPGQRRIIDAVLAGRDCIGVMPTGAGKSLTFQLPAKILPGTVLVISPLISLMKDQVDALERVGFRATLINSTLEPGERSRRIQALRRGEYELAYVAPEGLGTGLRALLANAGNVSLVVVDEAHCISHWGHDFRPAYRQLKDLKQQLGDIPVLALTATATRRVAADIIRELGMRKPDGFKGSFFRPNLRIFAHKKGTGRNTRKDILGLIRRHRGESAIVYCLSRRGVDSLTEWLRTQGVRALPYHAGLSDQERERNQEAFARDDAEVVVATVAFGMGIDKSNVRLIVHRDMPRSMESWYQEMGRAGRDGLPSDCVIFYSWVDVVGYDAFLDGIEDPSLRAQTRAKTVDLFRRLENPVPRCRHQALVSYFDEALPEPCGDACDLCLGLTLDDLVARSLPRSAAAQRALVALDERDRAFDQNLFDRLRVLRKRLADDEQVPAYVVFSDAVLRQMAQRIPRTPTELIQLSGVGPAKLQRYGAAFLELLGDQRASESRVPAADSAHEGYGIGSTPATSQ